MVVFRNPASKAGFVQISSNTRTSAEDVEIHDNGTGLKAQGTLIVTALTCTPSVPPNPPILFCIFEPVTVDLNSLSGSLLLFDGGMRLIHLEAMARRMNGQLYPRRFLIEKKF
jgi:hypothetical protein